MGDSLDSAVTYAAYEAAAPNRAGRTPPTFCRELSMFNQAKSVVFINGAWMTSACWDDFKTPFMLAGYAVHTLEWPYLTRDSQALRRDPPAALGGLSIK